MQSIFVFTIALFNLFYVAVALAQFSTRNISPSNATLRVRQSVSGCACSVGCTGCTAYCCPANQDCSQITQDINPADRCCLGTDCVVFPSSPSSSTSASTSSTSQTASSTTPSAITSLSTSATSPPSVSSAFPSHVGVTGSHNNTRIGSIVGGTVAGVVVAGIVIIVNLVHIKYLWGLLASALFGIFLFKSRRLVFSVDKDIGPTQISLFLTPNQDISDSTSGGNFKILVWKVFNIGYTQRQFNVELPRVNGGAPEDTTIVGVDSSHQDIDENENIDLNIPSIYGKGVPEIGFGTVADDGQHVTCETFGPAPAILNDEREWSSGSKANGRKLTATIHNVETHRIAVGTIDDTGIHPFLLVERDAFIRGESRAEYHAEGDLYLHVFRSIDYTAGKYGPDLVGAIRGDNLYPQGGIKIKALRPLTTWRIRSAGDNNLRLEICANQKEDVKRYKHDVVIKKDAQTSRS